MMTDTEGAFDWICVECDHRVKRIYLTATGVRPAMEEGWCYGCGANPPVTRLVGLRRKQGRASTGYERDPAQG